MDTNPILIEPGVRYFIGGTLKECRRFKDRNISIIFNISMLSLFVGMICFVLYYRYKGKPTPREMAIKSRKKQEYIMSKLQQMSSQRNKRSQDMITDLPTFGNHPEANILGRKIYQ
jgi:hypothetical protein